MSSGDIVRRFHELWSGSSPKSPLPKELNWGAELLTTYDAELVMKMLPKVVAAMRQAHFTEAKTFGATRTFYHTVIEEERKKIETRKMEQVDREKQAQEEAGWKKEKIHKVARFKRLRANWMKLSPAKRQEIQRIAIKNADSEFIKERIRRRGIDENVAFQVLDEFDRVAQNVQPARRA